MEWNRTRRHLNVALMAGLAIALAACRQQPASSDQRTTASAGVAASAGAAPSAAPGSAPDVESNAVQALDKMATYLRALKAFQVKSETSRDDVLDDGEKIEFAGTVDLLVQRPNRLRAEIVADRQQRAFFYDGSSFSFWAPRMSYYATVPAPATLAELSDQLMDKYDLEVPLADLFYWGERKVPDLKAATDIGASQVEGVSCEHYAFRAEKVDFQVWIQQGDYPLPRKLVVTTLTDDARPQYRSVLNWNLAPAFNDAAFKFDPPADAKKITFAESAAAGSK